MKPFVDLDIDLRERCAKRRGELQARLVLCMGSNMKKQRGNRLCISIIVLLGVELICSIAVTFIGMQRYEQLVQEQLGIVYEANPEAANVLVEYMLEGENQHEMLEKGRNVLISLGYTEESLYYLSRQSSLVKDWKGFVLLLAILLVGSVILLLRMHYIMQMEQQQLQKQLQSLEKRKAREEYEKEQNKRLQSFIENVAHQIKTPLSRISTSLDIMREEELEAVDREERIEECFGHLDSVNGLMKRLLDIGRLEAGKIFFQKEKIELPTLLQDTVKSCGEGASQIEIEYQSTMEKDNVFYGDYEWLKEAFLNILMNCLEHDRSGERILFHCRREQEYFVVTIRDHGVGFREAEIPNLFDRFYLPENAKASHVGIGLNLSKLIIEGHFGTIAAGNHEDGGAVFEILLPVYKLK